MQLKNDIKELTPILTSLKEKYGKDPFKKIDGKQFCEPEFMFYVVDYFYTIDKNLKKILSEDVKKENSIVSALPELS